VARALHHAHERGLIHRDVRPANILLTPDGKARLADFGLVKQVTDGVDLTLPGQGLGTLNFIAPEQFAHARATDRRCDVYALGGTLYMAVTGRRPFAASTAAQVVKKKVANELTRPRELMPAVGEQLDRIICRAMDPDCGQRPASCAEFLSELTGLGAALEPPPGATPARPSRRPGGSKRALARPRPQRPPTLETILGLLPAPTDSRSAEPQGGGFAWYWSVATAVAIGIVLGAMRALCHWGVGRG
jgi:serine/threonine-protein kinase